MEIKKKAETAKIVKNERQLIKQNDGQYRFVLNQEQIYSADARTNMLEEWKREIEDKEKWLKERPAMEKHMLEVAEREVKAHIANMEIQIRQDIKAAKEAIALWENPEE